MAGAQKLFVVWPFSGLAFASLSGNHFSTPMSSQDPRIEAIFHEALTGAHAERDAFVAEACAGDEALQQEVQRLLVAHEDAGAYFERPNSPEIEAELARLKPEQEGERIGRYKLLQEIGQGGFGTVWMAEQIEPVSRQVALKIIKMGMDTREVIARFEAERQALAMMDHPNIAKVFDAGATQWGRPFFVMELVKGLPITRFFDEQEFGIRQRLELFADVCSAINHAHQKGVIHRDIKPSNVMVTLSGDRPVVKVIDFGIAKAVQGKLTDRTLFTRFEQFIGTPVYMSPEQAAISELDIDTRSDIYGLGILLYELLTGKPPFDAKSLVSAGYEEMRRIIREVEPPRPSTRLRTIAGEDRTTLAKARRIAPEKLSHLVEPDLDWIVMKAIEKDRTRRYETANALALDIQRFLSDEPVSAGPPTAAYRFRKFARRNKAALRVAAAIAILLVVATAVSIWQAARATTAGKYALQKAADESAARAHAEAARADAEAAANFLYTIFESPQPLQKGAGLTVVECFSDALVKMKTELAGHPEPRYRMQLAITYILHTVGRTSEIIPYAEDTRDYYVRTRPPEHLEALRANHAVAKYYMAVNRWEEAKNLLERIYAIEDKFLPPEHSEAGALGMAMDNLAACYFALGQKDKALTLREKGLDYTQLRRIPKDHIALVWARESLASSYFAAERLEEALKLRESALASHRRAFKTHNPGPLLSAMENTAQSFTSVGREPDALRLRTEAQQIRQALEEGAGAGAGGLEFRKEKQQIAKALAERRFDDAVKHSHALVKLMPEALVAASKEAEPEAWLANALLLLAASEQSRQNSEKAAEASREAEEIIHRLRSRAPNFERVDLLMRYSHWKEATMLCRPLYQNYSGNPYTAFRLGPLLIKTGQTEDWEKLCHEVLLPFASAKPDQLEPLLNSLVKTHRGHAFDVIARVVCLRPPTDANLKWAIVLSDRAVKLVDDPNWQWYNFARSLAAYRAGNFSEAVASLEPRLPSLQKVTGADAYAVLAMSKHQMKDTDGAREALQAGEELFNRFWFSERRISVDPSVLDWLIADILLSEAKAMLGTEK
jgi:tetratricopeptide (TPR) repeat protein